MNKQYPYYQHKKLKNFKQFIAVPLKENENKIAFIYNNENKEEIKITYKEFYEDVNNLSNYLTHEYKNQHIALISENSYNYILLFFSIIISKNTAVLIDKDLPEEKIEELLKTSDCKIFFYSEKYNEYNNLKKEHKCHSFSDLIKKATEKKYIYKENKVKNKESVIFFTSGTTGANKAVMLSEENILSDIYSASSLFKPNGVVFSCLPFHHAFGLITSVLKPFYYQVPVFINNSLKYLQKEIRQSKPNNMFLVPGFIENFYKQIWKSAKANHNKILLKILISISTILLTVKIDLRKQLFKKINSSFGGNLEYIISGGAYLDPKYVKWFRSIGIEILNGYGITECSPVLAVNRNNYHKDGSVGQVVKDTEIKILDNEILVKGKIVMLGYYKDEKSTKEVIKNGYFHTGDFGYLDSDGFLFITGRKKNLIILSNGENISPETIEEKLMKDKGVCEVVIYSKNNKLIAAIYPNEEYIGNKKYFDNLIYKYNQNIPKNHQIAKINLWDKELPKNNNRKILRKEVMEEER